VLRVLFMGTPAFAVPTLQAVASHFDLLAVVTRQDKGRGRGRKTTFSAVKEWALEAGVPVQQPATLRDAGVHARLAAYRPDVIVVVAYGLILPLKVLDIPPLGCVNVHGSLLPRHRGAAPIAWAILQDDDETGVTTMLMDEGLDTGPMLLQRALPLQPADTTEGVAVRLAEIGARLLVETLEGLQNDSIVAQPQPGAGITLAPSFKKADGAVDWRQPAVAIDRQVRALQPWPGTFTFWRDERLVLWSVRPRVDSAGRPPGTVVEVGEIGDGRILVACGEGTLEIMALQRSGSRRQSAAEFLRGRPLDIGERLAPHEE